MEGTDMDPMQELHRHPHHADSDICLDHGGLAGWEDDLCQTEAVLAEVAAERKRQFITYGDNDGLALGMGPEVRWLLPLDPSGATDIEIGLRSDYLEWEEETGSPSWLHLIREEVAETFSAPGLDYVREEALQVAALCVSLVEKIDASREVGPCGHRKGHWVCRRPHHHGQTGHYYVIQQEES